MRERFEATWKLYLGEQTEIIAQGTSYQLEVCRIRDSRYPR